MSRRVWVWAGAGWLALVLLCGALTLYLDESESPGPMSTHWERGPDPSGTPSGCPAPTPGAEDIPPPVPTGNAVDRSFQPFGMQAGDPGPERDAVRAQLIAVERRVLHPGPACHGRRSGYSTALACGRLGSAAATIMEVDRHRFGRGAAARRFPRA